MAKLHGKEAKIYNGAAEIVSLRDLAISVQNKTADATDHDSGGWDEFIGGNKNWTGTSQHAKVLAAASQDALYDALVAASLLTINIYPNGVGVGQPVWSGSAIIEKWDYKAPNNDLQDISVSLKGSGALTRSVQ